MVRLMAILDQRIDTDGTKFAVVSLFAESKDDLSDDMEVLGMPKDMTIDWGSRCTTADDDFLKLTSSGEWK